MTKRILALTMLLSCAGLQGQSGARPVSLKTVGAMHLVDCAPVTSVPCMSVGVTAIDSTGKPAAITLAAGKPLTDAFSMTSGDGAEVSPFYASAGTGLDAGQHRNVVLMMIDISGSMLQPSPGAASRFAAVKGAIAHYLEAMEEGSDEIAIVPFESHNVVSTIRAAVFSTRKSDLLAQLNALPQPLPKNNTALFQAVFSGVDTMKSELASLEHDGVKASDLQPHLVVMTDGTNEVKPGDDQLLLNGPLGLQQAAAQVVSSGVDVVGVGFGERTAIDADALRRLSSRFFYAADANELLNALHVTRTAQSHVFELTWLTTIANRVALTGRDQVWTPSVSLADGTVLRGAPERMMMPATTVPLFARTALPVELSALIATHPPASSGWTALLVHLIVFVVMATLLLLLWFWVPRLIWQGQEMVPAATRWSSERPGVTVASGMQMRKSTLPEGFKQEQEVKGPLQRSAAQTTQVATKAEPGRTRLNFD